MRKLLILPFITALALVWVFGASADTQQFQQFQQTFQGGTPGDMNFFTLNALCDDCFDDNIDADSGSTAIGAQLFITGNYSWAATNDSVLSYTPGFVRQGSTLDTTTSTLAIPGTVTVNYHVGGSWGLFNDPDGAGDNGGPLPYSGTIFSQGVGFYATSGIPCALPLQGGTTTCTKDEYFGLVTLHVVVAQLQMRLHFKTTVELDSTGVVGVRTAVVDSGLPIADKPVTYIGSNPGTFSDPIFLACTQPAGEDFTYSFANMHLTANSAHFDHSAAINFAVLDPTGITTWAQTDTPWLNFTDATFNDPVTLTTPDQSFVLGKILPDVTPPTIDDAGDPYFGVEGSAVHFQADATDNCGAPTLRWDFSDGGVAFGANPEHTFVDNGVYSGLLTATDVLGLTTTTTFQVFIINAHPEVSAGPDMTYDWGRPVPFHANGSDAGAIDNLSLLYSWTFGDPNDPLGANGQDVTHTYSKPGSYAAQVTVHDKDGTQGDDTVNVTITRRDTSLGYTGATSGQITDSLLLRAALVDEYGMPVVGRSVGFLVDGATVAWAMTDSAGVAQVNWNIPLGTAPGLHYVVAAFIADDLYKGTTTPAALNLVSVQKETTVLTYTGPAQAKPSKTVPVSATLKDDDGNAVAGKTIVFTLGTQSCTAATDGSGIASCSIPKLSQKSGSYAMVVSFAGDANYLASGDSDPFTIG